MTIGAIVIGILSKVKIGAKNAIWYITFIIFETVMVLIGSDGFTGTLFGMKVGSIIPFTWATLIVFIVAMGVFYPWGVMSGFKDQFRHAEFTNDVLDNMDYTR